MWVQLNPGTIVVIATGMIAAIAGASGCASGGSSEVRADIRSYSDETAQVGTPSVTTSVDTGESTTVEAHWKADVISAATPVMSAPDAVTRATEYSETRHEGSVGAEWQPRAETNIASSYTMSFEPDNLSYTGSTSVSQDFFGRSSTATLGARLNLNEVGRSDVPDFERKLWIYGADAGWTQILSPSLLVRLSYSLAVRDGYQSNPYRYVPIWNPGADRPHLTVHENVPNQRYRHAWESLAIWSITPHLFLRAAYRFYLDGWSISSHRLRTALWWEHPEQWLRIRLQGRGYTQEGAHFFRTRYRDVPNFRTGDYRLAPMSSLDGGLRAIFRIGSLPGDSLLSCSASYDLVHYWLTGYPVFDSMFAHIAALSFKFELP